MPPPLPLLPKTITAIAVLAALAGCQTGPIPHPVPSVAQIGADLKCATGDHGLEDQQAGWGFCYPGSWKYNERSQASLSPPGLDLTFDITYAPATPAPCPSSSTSQGSPPSPCSGDFAFMIISTYERGGAGTLGAWIQGNLSPPPAFQPIFWGNALEAGKLSNGKRIAMTQHHVVIMDLHPGLLDLEGQMSSRLGTWRFMY